MLKLAVPALALLLAAGCYSANVPDGKLLCSVGDKKCPDGYHCASDGTCWHNGHDPMGVPDMAGTGGGLAGHKGSSVMSGAVSAKSEHYKVIMSTGQAPGGNGNASSTNFKKAGGLVGATQGK
jgi:hypothetical protein